MKKPILCRIGLHLYKPVYTRRRGYGFWVQTGLCCERCGKRWCV